jgi:hypothetical protein
MNAEAAVSLIREVGIARLCEFGPCLCATCEIQGVHIDISCRKSSGTGSLLIRVYSHHMDHTGAELRSVADIVAVQMQPMEAGMSISVRYCSYEDDHPAKCIYCGSFREDAKGYLCVSCLNKPHTIHRDYRAVEFACPPFDDDLQH